MPPPRSSGSHLPLWSLLALPFLVATWLRFHGLPDLEPFVDEGANILNSFNPGVRAAFEPLEQGRPLARQLFAVSHLFPSHALVVARVIIAFAGLTTMAGLAWVLYRFSGRAAALCGAWLWAVMPFMVFHERLALQDPASTALLVLALACVVAARAATSPTWSLAAGVFLGLAFLNKISAVFALPWLGLLYIAWQKQTGHPIFNRRLWWIAVGAAAVVLLYLRGEIFDLGSHLGRYHGLAGGRGGGSPGFMARLAVWINWYGAYGGWPLGLLVAGALGLQCGWPSRPALLAGAAWVATLPVDAAFYGNTYARYLHPDCVPLVLFIALSIGGAWGAITRFARAAVILGLIAALGAWLNVSRQIACDPASAPIPAEEKRQYVTGPWSGRGLNGVTQFLDDYANRNQLCCLVLTPRFYSPGCYGLMLAALGDPRLVVVPLAIVQPADLAAASPGLKKISAGQRVAFFLLYEGSLYPAPAWLNRPGGPARRVLAVPHDGNNPFGLYQFEP